MNDTYGKSVAVIESSDDDKFGANGGFTAVLSTPSLDRDGDRLLQKEWLDLPEWLPLDIDHGMTVADTIGKFHPYWDGDRMLMDAYFASTPKAQEARALVHDLKDDNGGSHPLGVSVAFMTDKSKKDGEARRELLNAGLVAIPSNRDAVILASKAASALQDAFSGATEGDALEEIKAVVLEQLSAKTVHELEDNATVNIETLNVAEKSHGKVYIDVEPRIDYEKFVKTIAEGLKAEGGGDTALKQAIHDASVHLGAICFPVVTDEDPSGAQEGANKGVTEIENKDGANALQLIAGVDAVMDEAFKLAGAVDRSTLPEPVGQALDLLTAAWKSIGEVMEALGIYDPDAAKSIDLEALKPEGLSMEQFESALKQMLTPSEEESPETPAPADEAAAAVSAESKSDVSTRARSMRMRVNALSRLQT